MWRSLLLSLPLLLWSCGAESELPNVVLILADDLGYGDIPAYNRDSGIPAPNLDRLAREGVRFTDAHSPSAVCTPTRYGLLTGCYGWRSRLKEGVLWGYSPSLMARDRSTVANLLKLTGYQTAAVGKWHLGLGDVPEPDYFEPLDPAPVHFGFDYFFGIPASLDMDPYVYVENDRAVAPPTEKVEGSSLRREGGEGFWREGAAAPGFRHREVLPTLTSKAVDVIDDFSTDSPFFLYFALTAPHTPWLPLRDFQGVSEAGPYGDFVVQVDQAVGQILEALEDKGVSGETMLIFTSDNGAHWLPSDIEQYGHRANAWWRGQKADIWEGGHRVPFIVRWPGNVEPGTTSEQLLCLTDVYATLAELVGRDLGPEEAEDSFSFLPNLIERPRMPGGRRAIVHHSMDGMFSIREGGWKLILGRGSGGFTPPRRIVPEPGEPEGQLYDLESDPQEQQNLYQLETEKVRELEALLEGWRRAGRSRPAGASDSLPGTR